MTSTLRNLKAFFLWLAERPGYKSRISFSDAEYFNPTAAHARIASARREARVPTIEQFEAVVAKMPCETIVQCRDRAIVAFLILSGARDGSVPSFKLKHLDIESRTIFHDAREVKTKAAKTFTSILFPVGGQFESIVVDYVARLKSELLFGPDDPIFPAPEMGQGPDRGSSLLDCLGTIGAMRRRSAALFETHLKPLALIIQTLIGCERHWRVSASRKCIPLKNGRLGAKT